MNEKLLREVMQKRGVSEESLLKKIKLNKSEFNNRIYGSEEFNLAEIIFISRALSLCENEIVNIFFE